MQLPVVAHEQVQVTESLDEIGTQAHAQTAQQMSRATEVREDEQKQPGISLVGGVGRYRKQMAACAGLGLLGTFGVLWGLGDAGGRSSSGRRGPVSGEVGLTSPLVEEIVWSPEVEEYFKKDPAHEQWKSDLAQTYSEMWANASQKRDFDEKMQLLRAAHERRKQEAISLGATTEECSGETCPCDEEEVQSDETSEQSVEEGDSNEDDWSAPARIRWERLNRRTRKQVRDFGKLINAWGSTEQDWREIKKIYDGLVNDWEGIRETFGKVEEEWGQMNEASGDEGCSQEWIKIKGLREETIRDIVDLKKYHSLSASFWKSRRGSVEEYIHLEQFCMDSEFDWLEWRGWFGAVYEHPAKTAEDEEKVRIMQSREFCRFAFRKQLLQKLLIARHVDGDEERVKQLLEEKKMEQSVLDEVRKKFESSKVDISALRLDALERKIREWTKFAFPDVNKIKQAAQKYVTQLVQNTDEGVTQKINTRVAEALRVVELEFGGECANQEIFAEHVRTIPYFTHGLQSGTREATSLKFSFGKEVMIKDFVWVVNRHSKHQVIANIEKGLGKEHARSGIRRLKAVYKIKNTELEDFWSRAHLASYLGCVTVLDDLARAYVDYCNEHELHPFAHEQEDEKLLPYLKREESLDEVEKTICEQYYFKHNKWLDERVLEIKQQRLEEYTGRSSTTEQTTAGGEASAEEHQASTE